MATIDKTTPKLVSSTPKLNSAAVKVAQNIVLKFDEPIKAGTGNITISNGSDTHVITITDKSQVKISGTTLTINPKSDLQSDSLYSVKIAPTAIKDAAGNNFKGITDDKTLSFSTIDKTPPVLKTSHPANESVDIDIKDDIVLTFSEAIKAGGGSIKISNGTDSRSISITDKSQVSISGNTLTINPKADLKAGSHYTLTLASTAIKDLANNKFAGISTNAALSFDTSDGTIDKTPPQLRTTSPANGNKLVAVNRNISFSFDEKVQLGEGNIVLSDGVNVIKIPVTDASQVSLKTSTLTLNPKANLDFSKTYTVTLEKGAVKDLSGNAFLGNGEGFTFSTQASPDKTAPKLTTTSPADNAVNVLTDANLVLTFDEVIKAGKGNLVISNGTDIRTIPVTDSQVSISGKTLTINPKDNLLEGASYHVKIEKGAILDSVSNAFAGITNTTTFNFDTKAAPVFAPVLTKGKAIDGYLKNADVFADANGNGVWDKTEAQTTTDAFGNFTLTNAKGTLIVTGGIDLSTGKVFKGALKAPAGSTVVTPFTTLLQSFIESGQTLTQAKQSVGKAFGFDATAVDLITYDPISEFVKAGSTTTLLKTSGFELTAGNELLAQKLIALSAQIVNFLVTATQALQGAAGGSGNLSTKDAMNALSKSLVSAIKDAGDSGKTVSLSDSTLLKSVILDGAKQASDHAAEVAKESGSTEAPKFDSGKFSDKVNALADTVTSVVKDAADNIAEAVAKGGSALEILSNVDKTSSFSQNHAGESLGKLAESLDATDSATLANALKDALVSLTGDAANKFITETIVDTIKAVTDVVAADQAAADKAAADKVAPAPEPSPSPAPAPAPAPAPTPAPTPAPAPDPSPSPAPAPAPPPDTTPPTLSSSTPADNATGVAIASNIVLTFSETVTKGTTGNIVITNATDATDTRTIVITDATQVTVSGSTVTINPTADLKPGYDYNVKIDSGAIKDGSGNAYTGISDTTTLNFTTVPNGTTANPVTNQTSGNDIIKGNQSSILGAAISFNAAQGADQYVFSAIKTGTPAALPSANVTISGFSAASGDRLVFDVADTATGLTAVNAFYSISDNKSGNIEIIVNDDGNVQLITLQGLTGLPANGIHNMNELSAFLDANAFAFI